MATINTPCLLQGRLTGGSRLKCTRAAVFFSFRPKQGALQRRFGTKGIQRKKIEQLRLSGKASKEKGFRSN